MRERFPFVGNDLHVAFAKLEPEDQKNVRRCAKRLSGQERTDIKVGGIRGLGGTGAMELLAAVGRYLNETD